jgi:tetratricopeptide (TPR) repeat protein
MIARWLRFGKIQVRARIFEVLVEIIKRTARVAKKSKAAKFVKPESKLESVQIVEYEITSEPIRERWYKSLPKQVKDAIDRLHDESQRRPHKAIPELIELIKKYPNIPMLYNYLSVAYSGTGEQSKAEEIIRENYQRNPDYLFARLNYAELCRAAGDYEQIAEIFEYKFDLKLLYPQRKRFHVSEVANYMGLIGMYYLGTGEQAAAEKYYEILKEVAPGYPMTKRLGRKLHPSFFRRILNRIAGQVQTESS